MASDGDDNLDKVKVETTLQRERSKKGGILIGKTARTHVSREMDNGGLKHSHTLHGNDTQTLSQQSKPVSLQ